MIHLIKKDLFRVLLYLLPVFLILIFFFLVEGDTLTRKSPYIWVFYMFILVSGALFTIEKNEEKHGGYHFLARLPVTDREIVAAKFILLLLVVLMLLAANLALSFTGLVPPEFSGIIRLVMVAFGWAYLTGIGLIYVLIFKMGYTRAMTTVWVTFIAGLFTFIFLLGTVLKLADIDLARITRVMLNLNPLCWIVLSVLSLGLYVLLMEAAIRMKTKSRRNQVT
jgi:ABC-type transport system involved in multi-copper enzyme maturation permease subunit